MTALTLITTQSAIATGVIGFLLAVGFVAWEVHVAPLVDEDGNVIEEPTL